MQTMMVAAKEDVRPSMPPLALLLLLQSAPASTILNAFSQDCQTWLQQPWWSPLAQAFAVDLLHHPLMVQHPPRPSTIYAFTKMYFSWLEKHHATCGDDAHVDDLDALSYYTPRTCVSDDPVHEELLTAFIDASGSSSMSGPTREDLMCCKSFFRGGVHQEEVEEGEPCATTLLDADHFCVLRVAAEQFVNVGLSLWPAAFVLAELLAQDFSQHTDALLRFIVRGGSSTQASRGCIRMLELGAGVGLTPIYCSQLPMYARLVESFVLTDYQDILVDNMEHNLHLNRCASSGEKGEVQHCVERMDWMELDACRTLLHQHRSNVVLAADCIYDACIIPDLARVVKLALAEDVPNTEGVIPSCVVVQTHRQASTMKIFFDAARQYATVRSFAVVCDTPEAIAHGVERQQLAPLGDASRRTNNDGVATALQPAVVLADGSLRVLRPDSHLSRLWFCPSSTLPEPDGISPEHFVEETAEVEEMRLLDAWIGPFHTSMAGLIGVHLLQPIASTPIG